MEKYTPEGGIKACYLFMPDVYLRSKYVSGTLFSNTLCLSPSISVKVQVSHPYKTTGRIMALYNLTFTFLDINIP
jgi:hypothetical protein